MAQKKDEKISQGLAIAALLLNVLVLPGLGSIIGGKMKEGIIQLVLTVVSIPLMFILIGFPLALGMWIWALVTGIQILKEAE
ncbi:hypothetical protein GF367_03660 [Candidatus Woesearchaeota archaeon]|nr:hypothetical protein [Candidatus Woesearchaeota archaeon]